MKRPDITYEYYFNECCGGQSGTVPQERFEFFICRALDELDAMCTGDWTEEQRSGVCRAACLIAEELYTAQQRNGIHSENIDGYSVTYTESDRSALSARLWRIAAQSLGNYGLLYRGADVC